MITSLLPAMSGLMDQRIDWPARTAAWFNQNLEALLIGLAVAAGLVLVMLVLRTIGERIRAADPDCSSWRSVIGHVLAKTGVIFMVIAALDTVGSYVEAPRLIARLLDIAFIIAFALQGAVWARELIIGVIGHKVRESEGSGTLSNATGVIRVLVSVTLFAVAIILILDNLGVNVTALIAGLGIGGIAIGLAAQGIFSDLFAALAILFDKPFKRGDTIRYDQSTGTVERIGLKTTRLRSLTGEQLVMANTKLLEREIHNLAAAKARRMTVYFAVEGKAAGETLDAVATAADQAVGSQKGCKLVRCVLSGVGAGGLAHELVYDDSALDNDKIARNRADILRGLIERLEKDKLELVQASNVAPPLAPF